MEDWCRRDWNQRRDRVQEAPDRNSQSPKGAVQRTSSSARGIHVARQRRRGEWRPRNMMGGKCPLWMEKLDPRAVARKLDEMDDMHEVLAKWKRDKQARKTDVECRTATWNPRPKITVTLRCRAENVQLGKGYSCGTAARRWQGGEWRPRKIDGRHRWELPRERKHGRTRNVRMESWATVHTNVMHPQDFARVVIRLEALQVQVKTLWTGHPAN